MTTDMLDFYVWDLHGRAHDIRARRNAMIRAVPTLPLSASNSMRDAAQALDDAARDLLSAYGEELPGGVL